MLLSCSRNGVSKWIDGSLPSLYSGIDMIQFREQVGRNQEAWDAAHAFLLRQDLDTLSPGVYPITDNGVYAIVSEYETKQESKYEAHRAYVDIQYVTSGQEYIYSGNLDGFVSLNGYDKDKDIIFFSDKDSVDRYVADMQFGRAIGASLSLGAAWGFRGADELLENGADAVFDNPLDMAKYIYEKL